MTRNKKNEIKTPFFHQATLHVVQAKKKLIKLSNITTAILRALLQLLPITTTINPKMGNYKSRVQPAFTGINLHFDGHSECIFLIELLVIYMPVAAQHH